MTNLKVAAKAAEELNILLAEALEEISVEAKFQPAEFLKDSIVKAGGE